MNGADSRSMETESTSNMTSTYAKVMVLEAAIIVLLWLLGRLFS